MINKIVEKNSKSKKILCQWDDEKKHEPKKPKVFSLGGDGWDYFVLCYSQCLPPRCLQYHHNFILDALPKIFTYLLGPKWRYRLSHLKLQFWGAFKDLVFFPLWLLGTKLTTFNALLWATPPYSLETSKGCHN
jgi:hypothetical protein